MSSTSGVISGSGWKNLVATTAPQHLPWPPHKWRFSTSSAHTEKLCLTCTQKPCSTWDLNDMSKYHTGGFAMQIHLRAVSAHRRQLRAVSSAPMASPHQLLISAPCAEQVPELQGKLWFWLQFVPWNNSQICLWVKDTVQDIYRLLAGFLIAEFGKMKVFLSWCLFFQISVYRSIINK